MNTINATAIAKVIVLDAHRPEQMAIVKDCAHAGHPVTFYADHLTDDIQNYSRLGFVQARVGQRMDVAIVEDGSTMVFA
jgi:hypothetical protein